MSTSPEVDSRTPALPAWARWQAGQLTLAVHAQPGARRSAVVGEHGGRLKIALQAPPVDGKANEELLRFLAQQLGRRRSELTLASGQTSRTKVVALAIEAAEVAQVLASLGGGVWPPA